MADFSVPISKLVKHLDFELVSGPVNLDDLYVTTADVNRPGLILAGYDEYFEPSRIQILGNAEMHYLGRCPEDKRRDRIEALFRAKPPAVIISRELEPFEEMIEFADTYEVPLFATVEATSTFMSNVISLLNVELAPRVTRHGVLVEVYGEGIFIKGESGVGKSETAIELLKRGHRLIADDAVELRRVSNRTIVGQAPENIRHFIELRGIGIINVNRIFGTGAVKQSEKLDLVVELEPWDKHKNYSRTGLENNTVELMGIRVPLSVIPVRPGRNLAVIIEIAAIDNRQKKMGYNAAHELLNQLGLKNDITEGSNFDF